VNKILLYSWFYEWFCLSWFCLFVIFNHEWALDFVK
jgi:hypothetical protein